MAISEKDIKLLWGRAAGMCSRPGCGADLTRLLDEGGHYVVGEMAHVIAEAEKGPRGIAGGGENTYDNLILLCPTDHRDVDKAPAGTFDAQQLHDWKRQHEVRIRNLGSEEVFGSNEALRHRVSFLLTENRNIWASYGPRSDAALSDPGSNLFAVWELRRADRIVPNNRRIINITRWRPLSFARNAMSESSMAPKSYPRCSKTTSGTTTSSMRKEIRRAAAQHSAITTLYGMGSFFRGELTYRDIDLVAVVDCPLSDLSAAGTEIRATFAALGTHLGVDFDLTILTPREFAGRPLRDMDSLEPLSGSSQLVAPRIRS